MSNIYARIRSRREELGLSQEELAARMGYKSKSSINKIEMGVNDIPQSKVFAFAKALETTTAYLMGCDDTLPPNILPMPKTRKVPRLGSIACGTPILAAENLDGYDDVADYIQCDFTLLCKGDSMINARIFDGDIVCIRQQPEVENGEIAAVLIDGEFDGEATLKRVRMFDDHIILEPENPQYRPLAFWGDEMQKVHVLGKATHFISAVK